MDVVWDAWAPLPDTELAERYFTRYGTCTEAGRLWKQDNSRSVAASYAGRRRQAWKSAGKRLVVWGPVAAVSAAIALWLGVLLGVTAMGVIVVVFKKDLEEARALRVNLQTMREYAEVRLQAWARMTAAERDDVRRSRRSQRRRDVALGVAAAPFVLAAGAVKLFGLGDVADLLGS